MSLSNIFALLGGIALFLFGMTLMGEGLKKVAGSSLEMILFRLSGTPLKGMLLGTGVTAVIQSSSATSVMVVGFVNSGIMNLTQAVSVIIGSILGTSITGWVICLSNISGSGWISLLSTATLSSIIAVGGIVLRMFSKDQKKRHLGDIMLGFSVLMFGMQMMSGAVSPLRESPAFVSVITAFSNPVLGIAAGALFAAVLQSASAAVGILQALSMTGVITFSAAFPIILGIAAGAAVPVLLSAIGAKTAGRRSAWAYLAVSAAGAIICGAAFYAADAAVNFGFADRIMSPVSVAVVNTLFRAVTAFLLLPFVGGICKVLARFIPESEKEKAAGEVLDRLDERFLRHPALAVEQSCVTVNTMAEEARANILSALKLIWDYSEAGRAAVEEQEDLIDRYEDKIGTYLLRLNSNELDKKQNERVSEYLHTISDFERISDHAMNIAESAQEIFTKKIRFSPQAENELKVLFAAIEEILNISFTAFISGDDEAQYAVEPLEERIDVLCDEMKLRHVERMQTGVCSMNQGFVFSDIITNLERVADHCSNIAVAMIEITGDEYKTHEYVIDLKALHAENFDRLYNEYAERYKI